MRPRRTAQYQSPSTGKMLKEYIDKNRIYKSVLGRKLNLHIKSILEYQKNDTIQTAILWDISNALKHNFFMDLAVQLPKEFSTSIDLYAERDAKIAQLEHDLMIMKIERDLLLKISGK